MQDIEDLHLLACQKQQNNYIDPSTGLRVFTAHYLLQRGKCCGCGCRHCPYKPNSKYKQPSSVVLHGDLDSVDENVDLLFFSGGKDSYLAFKEMTRIATRQVLLVTTYDAATKVVAHQGVTIDEITSQARALRVVLIGVPIGFGGYEKAIRRMIKRLEDHGIVIQRIAFGDLHLQHIREWREKHLADLAELYFPIWGLPYPKLLAELEKHKVIVRVTAVEDGLSGVKVGDIFDRHFVSRLDAGVDGFGERGEFHTRVHIPEEVNTPAERFWRIFAL